MRRPWLVIGILFLLAFITIVDRVCISAAKTSMATDLRIPDLSFGLVFGAFALGYGVFMAPSGWAGDWLGARRFLTLIVCLWSACTVATGLAQTLPVLIAVRFLFGGAEAGAFPTAARAIHTWLPVERRGLAMGLLNTGSRLGAAFGLAAMSLSVSRLGWGTSFVVLGMAGFAWAAGWYLWYRDGSGSRAETVAAPATTLVSRNTVLILYQYFASNFTFFICFSWLLPYVRQQYGVPAEQAGVYASIPLYCGAAATWSSGLLVDWLHRRGHHRLSRRLPAAAGFALAAISLIAAAYAQTTQSFILAFAVTTFGVDFTLSPSWTLCADIAGSRTGTLSGAMNALGSLGSFASSICFPWLLGMTGSVKTYFFVAVFLNCAAIACWLAVRL